MKTYIVLIIFVISFGCKEKIVTSKSSLETNSVFIQKNEKLNIIIEEDFLSYVDKDMGFQESTFDSLQLYAWCCKIQNNKVFFSGMIYLTPKKKDIYKWKSSADRDSIIDNVNSEFKKVLSEFNLWAAITHKEYFLPFERIDNPCEYYTDDRVICIYSFVRENKWKLMGKIKNEEEIEKFIKSCGNILCYPN